MVWWPGWLIRESMIIIRFRRGGGKRGCERQLCMVVANSGSLHAFYEIVDDNIIYAFFVQGYKPNIRKFIWKVNTFELLLRGRRGRGHHWWFKAKLNFKYFKSINIWITISICWKNMHTTAHRPNNKGLLKYYIDYYLSIIKWYIIIYLHYKQLGKT